MKIVLKNIKKSFIKNDKKITVLDNITELFVSGNLYAIIGQSGSGKSTLLNCLTAILTLDEGTIYFDNLCLNTLNDDELAKWRNQNIGYVFQDYNLLDFLNAYENIITPLVIGNKFSFKNKEPNNQAMELLKFVGLEERCNHYPNELSGGEQQRIAIARALINNPEIILCDEPTGSIDLENSSKILKLLKKIANKKCVIITTHDTNVLKYADKIFKLEKGKLKEYEIKR